MDNMMLFDDKMKRRMGIICFIPAISFVLDFIYFLVLIWPTTHGNVPPNTTVGITEQNYDTLFALLAISCILSAGSFIYCLVILARLKNMNAAAKIIWIILLSVMAPLASVLFWYFLIKRSPKYVPIHPDIT